MAKLGMAVRILGIAIVVPLSPTWAIAALVKGAGGRVWRTGVIQGLNLLYLTVAIISLVAAVLRSGNLLSAIQADRWNLAYYLWAWFLLSRCNEIFVAFYCDATDKLGRIHSSSDLSWAKRVGLALRSYAELVINFALIYSMLGKDCWQTVAPVPKRLTDAVTYSAMTITTSGGGGFLPADWRLQLLSCYEISCGLILLVVCFTIYTSRAHVG